MLSIHGMGYFLPDNEISNEFLNEQVGIEKDPAWVKSRLGIERRFSVLKREYILATKNRNPSQAILHARASGLTPVTMGIEAARRAIAQARLRPSQIGWVIANNDTPFETVPCTAAQIAKVLGVPPGPHCDINTACSSFATHLQLINSLRNAAVPDYVLCVQTGAYTVRTDYSAGCIDGYIWGDGAAAQVLSTRYPGRIVVEPLMSETDPRGADDIVIDSVGHFAQNGKKVRELSVRKTCELYEAIADSRKLDLTRVFTVSHQANYVMQNSILTHLGIPKSRHLRNVHQQGNIAAAGCPSVLAQNWDRLRKGDKILYAVVGAGSSWGSGYMEVL